MDRATAFRSLPASGGFDLGCAYWMARGAEIVYRHPHEMCRELREEWGLEQFEFFDLQDTQAFVAADENVIVVSFRGTEPNSLRDWVTDASTRLIPGPLEGHVHAGFYDALANVWQLLDRFVRHLQHQRRRKLFVTGHSLGAALGTLAVARWISKSFPVDGLYTFGQPRTGDETFARAFNFEFKPFAFRFVNNNDLVTRMPPRAFGYSHLGTFKYFTEDGVFAEEIAWWRRFLDGWKGRIEDVFDSGDDAIKDHNMGEYCRRIEAAYTSRLASFPWNPIQAIDRFLGDFVHQGPPPGEQLSKAA